MVFANGSRYLSPGAICDRFGKQLCRKHPGSPLVIAAVIAALGCSAGSGESWGGGGQPGTGTGGGGAGTGGSGGNGQAGASSPSGGTTGFGGQGGASAGTAGALSGSGGAAATGGTGAGGTTSSAGAAGTGTSRGGAGGSSGGTGGASPPRDPFNVVTAGAAVDIYVDAADVPAVVRAVGDLRADVQRVSGTAPVIKNSTAGLSSTAIMVGTLGKSPAIDALAAAGKLDTMGVAGKWESAVIQAVANPVAGVTRALVIAGSDRRGTVYGIYELSQRIGVSPWYWWADVAPTPSTTITVDGGVFKQGEPTVKYRGIFINDEENFTTWAGTKLDAGKKPGPETYKKVFELLLRLKANFLWPAMHPVSDEFNKYAENAANAELVRHRDGIVASRDDVAEQRQGVGPLGQRSRIAFVRLQRQSADHLRLLGCPRSDQRQVRKRLLRRDARASMTAASWRSTRPRRPTR